jgi:pimeloyl-ACP methyl ester carboxylesterase
MTRRKNLFRTLAAAGLALAASGCAAHFKSPIPVENIVMVDRAGAPVDPTGNARCSHARGSLCDGDHLKTKAYRRLTGKEYRTYLDNLFAGLDAFPADPNGKQKILLYIHGGLNTQFSTIERAYCAQPTVEQGGYFPIYLNWQSNLFTSYVSQLYFVRKGRRHPAYSPVAWGLSPFYLAKDLARAATRAVPIWSFMIASDARSLKQSDRNKTDQILAYKQAPETPQLDLREGDDQRGRAQKARSLASYIFTFPTKLLISPILDAAGTPAWAGMLRGAETAFRNDELDPRFAADAGSSAFELGRKVRATDGGFEIFLDGLKQYIAAHGGPSRFEVVLVGHSAGAIVLNHIVRLAEDGSEGRGSLPVTDIVYMASAATIGDYEDTLFPYLLRHKGKNQGEGTQVYHLVLHQMAEVRDRVSALRDVPPRGSLLVWIDNFLSERRNYRDRTAGRIESLTSSLGDLDSWQEIVPQIHIREFDAGAILEKNGPQHHGDFGRLTYWSPDCWKTHPQDPQRCYDQALVGRDGEACKR